MDKAKVIDPKIIKVRNTVYNVIRSFVESSTKDKYEWNTCIKMPPEWGDEYLDIIICEKTGKWRLKIVVGKSDGGISASLFRVRPPYTLAMTIDNDKEKKTIDIDSELIELDKPDTLPSAILLVPEDREKVKYPRPISLAEVISKLQFYGVL